MFLVFGRKAEPDLPLPGDLSSQFEHLGLAEVALEPEGSLPLQPEQDIAGKPRVELMRLAVAEYPGHHVPAALDPDPELPDLDGLDLGVRARELLANAGLIALELDEQER